MLTTLVTPVKGAHSGQRIVYVGITDEDDELMRVKNHQRGVYVPLDSVFKVLADEDILGPYENLSVLLRREPTNEDHKEWLRRMGVKV